MCSASAKWFSVWLTNKKDTVINDNKHAIITVIILMSCKTSACLELALEHLLGCWKLGEFLKNHGIFITNWETIITNWCTM